MSDIPEGGPSHAEEARGRSHGASFRDPSGFLFTRDGTLYRQINRSYAEDYETLLSSGLYEILIERGLLIPHEPADVPPLEPGLAHAVIRPEAIPFISYPYEWCFGELKDAALATLRIQKLAFKHGMVLKDASAYNIQFRDGQPILIDTLSFERYREGEPWIAYRQFCQHFLAPLALMSTSDVRLSQLFRVYIDGVPLDLAARLLPWRTRLNFGLLSHIHLHAASQRRFADKTIDKESVARKMGANAFQGLIDSLTSAVKRLDWRAAGSEWGDYYDGTQNYSPQAQESKKAAVKAFLEQVNPSVVWDLGANTGVFSRLASEMGALTMAFDIDPDAVEVNYRQVKAQEERNLLPLLQDLTNPSPALGWAGEERMSLLERGPADAVLALALIHHLAISNNVPLDRLGEFFRRAGRWLMIEFVPKSDPQVRKLLATREDIFPDYTREGFERAFQASHRTHAVHELEGSERVLYLMESI